MNVNDAPEDFEEQSLEALRGEVRELKSKLDMMFQCVKALSEGRSVMVHQDGRIFIQAPSFQA